MVLKISPGEPFGRLVAHHPVGPRLGKWVCHCQCGGSRVVPASDLRAKRVNSCGCWRVLVTEAEEADILRRYDAGESLRTIASAIGRSKPTCSRVLAKHGVRPRASNRDRQGAGVGRRVGRLVVVRPVPSGDGNRNRLRYVCQCDCGKECSVLASHLYGKTAQQSCGCVRDEFQLAGGPNRQHGRSRTKSYRVWQAIKSRCNNPRCHAYPRYGGRGIRICSRWSGSVADFYADIGSPPAADSEIDRINNNAHYSCGTCQECMANGWVRNVRWATRTEQARNRSNTIHVTYRGEEKSLVEWCEAIGLPYPLVFKRLNNYGWPVEKAFNTPRRNKGRPRPPRTVLRNIWYHIISRCTKPHDRNFPDYGGRGITVCPEWRESFDRFAADMGPRPSPAHTIHRMDNDGPYSPDNCCWATADVQQNTKRHPQKMRRSLPRRLAENHSPQPAAGVVTSLLLPEGRRHPE